MRADSDQSPLSQKVATLPCLPMCCTHCTDRQNTLHSLPREVGGVPEGRRALYLSLYPLLILQHRCLDSWARLSCASVNPVHYRTSIPVLHPVRDFFSHSIRILIPQDPLSSPLARSSSDPSRSIQFFLCLFTCHHAALYMPFYTLCMLFALSFPFAFLPAFCLAIYFYFYLCIYLFFFSLPCLVPYFACFCVYLFGLVDGGLGSQTFSSTYLSILSPFYLPVPFLTWFWFLPFLVWLGFTPSGSLRTFLWFVDDLKMAARAHSPLPLLYSSIQTHCLSVQVGLEQWRQGDRLALHWGCFSATMPFLGRRRRTGRGRQTPSRRDNSSSSHTHLPALPYAYYTLPPPVLLLFIM